MLSEEEKKEMLEDARSDSRRLSFRAAKNIHNRCLSFDEYLAFLTEAQYIFSAFPVSGHKTITKFNKL
jgi:hypothetical protein